MKRLGDILVESGFQKMLPRVSVLRKKVLTQKLKKLVKQAPKATAKPALKAQQNLPATKLPVMLQRKQRKKRKMKKK